MNFDNNDKNLKAFFQKSLGDTNPKRELTHKKGIYSQILVTNPEPTRIQYWLYKFLNIFNMDKQVILKGLVTLLALGGTTTGTVVVADKAAPGDTLYGIDRAVENIQLHLVRNAEKQAELNNKLLDERMAEINKIKQDHEKYTEEDIQEAMDNLKEQEAQIRDLVNNNGDIPEDVKIKIEENLDKAERLQEKAKTRYEQGQKRREKAKERMKNTPKSQTPQPKEKNSNSPATKKEDMGKNIKSNTQNSVSPAHQTQEQLHKQMQQMPPHKPF